MSQILKQKVRKELNRWSRKLLLTIGLESVGRELVGEEKWEQIYPLQLVWAQENASVFDPTEEVSEEPETNDISQIDPSDTTEEETSEERNDVLENLFRFLPYWYFINRGFGVPGVGVENANPDELSQLNLNNGMLEMLDAQRLLFLQSLEHQQQLAQQNLNSTDAENFSTSKFHSESNSNVNLALPRGFLENETVSDEPLDLTKKNKNVVENEFVRGNYSALSTTKSSDDLTENGFRKSARNVSSTSRVATRANQRAGRGYTSEELDAALKDIQSGKLGTRRAAVIYGIPRSTLRNKVYKLGKDRAFIRQVGDRKRVEVVVGGTSSLRSSPQDVQERIQEEHQILRPGLEISSPGMSTNLTPFYSLHEEYPNNDQDEDGAENYNPGEAISPQKKVLKEWLRSKLSRQGFTSETSSNSNIESFLPNDESVNPDMCPNDSSEEGNSDISNGGHESVLKIPSVKNNSISSGRQGLRRKRNGGAQLLNMRVPINRVERASYWKNVKSDGASYNSPFEYDSEIDSSNGVSSNGVGMSELRHDASSRSGQHSVNKSIAEVDEKKSRPKRGKYRNYDRDALLKAVKAVQNGEMSVHRAGSYFGVPHSTLEYKVKERHLLRRPKRKGGAGSPKSTQRSSPDSSLSGSELPSNPDELSENHAAGGGERSNTLPLSSDLRESLSRYLNLNAPFGAYSSSPSSPETPINSTDQAEALRHRISEHHDSGHVRASESAVFNILSKFSRLGSTRETNSLLDLSKKF